MGNKNTSPHLTKSNGHDNYRLIQQQNFNNTDDIETASYRNSNGKKHGPSPRFRRRQSKQGKKSQVDFRRPTSFLSSLTLIFFSSLFHLLSMLAFNRLVIERQVYFLVV